MKDWIKNKKYVIGYIFFGIIIIVVVFCQIKTSFYYAKKESQFETLRPDVPAEAVSNHEDPIEIITEDGKESVDKIYCDSVYNFTALQKENSDIYAWLIVPGTDVDYPILQNEEDNFYLLRNLDKSEGKPGCLYTNKVHPKDFTAFNTIIYGHNMKNKTMFGSLHNFDDEEFFEENNIFILYTEDCRLTYEIYATTKTSDDYLPYIYDFDTQDGQKLFLHSLLEDSSSVHHMRHDMEVCFEDKFVTLSTCMLDNHYRFLVVGKLIETAFYKE